MGVFDKLNAATTQHDVGDAISSLDDNAIRAEIASDPEYAGLADSVAKQKTSALFMTLLSLAMNPEQFGGPKQLIILTLVVTDELDARIPPRSK